MTPNPTSQQGVILLEALIGILIFSLGILALVAMQAVAVSSVSNAQYRADAAFLANDLISEIWVDRGTSLDNVKNYAVSAGSTSWQPAKNWTWKVYRKLPGSFENKPDVVITDPPEGGKQVTVTIRWKSPEAVTVSNHVAIAFVSDP